MMLGDDFHGEMVLFDIDVRIVAHRFHQSSLYLRTGIVGMVENTEFRVASLAVQVKVPVFLVEVDSPVDEFFNL